MVKAFNELFIVPIYDNLQDEAPTSPPISAIQLKEEEEEPQDSLALRRAAFLARKTNNSTANPVTGINTVKRKLKKELDRFLKLVERKPESLPRIPLLARFWKAHSSFPATFTSAEQAFSMDGLIFQPSR